MLPAARFYTVASKRGTSGSSPETREREEDRVQEDKSHAAKIQLTFRTGPSQSYLGYSLREVSHNNAEKKGAHQGNCVMP